MRSKKMFVVIALTAVAILAAACNTPAPTAAPTTDPKVFQTTLDAAATQAVQTVKSQFTQTAEAKPTEPYVPIASATVDQATIVTATALIPTATVFIPTWTLAPTSKPVIISSATPAVTATSSAYSCSISLDPVTGTSMPAGYDFDGKFKVTNTGTEKWAASDVDLRYSSGQKFQKNADSKDLPNDLAKGESYTFLLDFLAPTDAGNYTSTWSVVRGSSTLCSIQFYYTITK